MIDNANFTKVDLENQIDSMNAELLDLTKTHEEVGFQTVHVPGYRKTVILFFIWLQLQKPVRWNHFKRATITNANILSFVGCETAL